jgi:GH24 family phage-related lysozyme (muramidase)
MEYPSEDPTKPKFKYDNATDKYVAFADTDELPPANCSQGYNCIGWGSLAKNVIIVESYGSINYHR